MKYVEPFIPDTIEGSLSTLGEMGDPIPYSYAGDDILVIAILTLTILSVSFWIMARGFLRYQLHNILDTPRDSGATRRETIRQLPFLRYFIFQLWILAGFFCYEAAIRGFGLEFRVPGWAMMLIYAGIMLLCEVVFSTIRNIPNIVYFDNRQRSLYHVERITFLAYNGLITLPFAFYTIFFGGDIILHEKILLCCLCFVKIIEISKVYSIFFRKNGRFLHFFLYLCTLEVVPILLTVGILTITTLILQS